MSGLTWFLLSVFQIKSSAPLSNFNHTLQSSQALPFYFIIFVGPVSGGIWSGRAGDEVNVFF